MLFLPIIDPLCNSGAVAFDIVVLFTVQFHHDFLVKRFAGFLEKDTKNFRI